MASNNNFALLGAIAAELRKLLVLGLPAGLIRRGRLRLPILDQGGASSNQVLTWNGSAWAPAAAQAGFTNPMTTLGDLIYENATPAAARLAGDTSNTRKFLRTHASGGVAQAPTWDVLIGADIASIIKGYIYGLPLAYASTTSITVGTGQAIDSANATLLSLSAQQTISTGTLGAINGLDRTAIAGTVATNSANATVTGTGTAFTTAFNPISIGSGHSSSGTTLTLAAGTMAQPGPPWPLAIGDLVGNAAKGYYRVTAISAYAASGMTATLVSTPGSAFVAGDALNRIENAWFQANAQTVRQINTVTSDTNLTLSANSSGTESGVTGYIGALPSGQVALHVWLGTGGSGTGVWLSTQRTVPLGVSGYSTYYRRIGSVIWDGTTPTIIPFDQSGMGIERYYQFECASTAHNSRILNGGTSGSWTSIFANALAPPSANAILSRIATSGSGGYFRLRGVGDTTTSRNLAAGTNINMTCPILCDGSQAIDYVSISGSSDFIDMFGYTESLQ